MLEMRSICERCGCDLPADSTEARICSYECTFCRSCVEAVLMNVCPNCGGGFAPRPVRSAAGLCARCAHARVQQSARSRFWRCARADSDPALRRYPQLPVTACHGYAQSPEGN